MPSLPLMLHIFLRAASADTLLLLFRYATLPARCLRLFFGAVFAMRELPQRRCCRYLLIAIHGG